jgi:hypothetical protein
MPRTRLGRPPASASAAKPRDHPGLRAAGHGADDDRVEEDAELALLVRDLDGPVRVAQAAKRVVGGAGWDRVRTAAG